MDLSREEGRRRLVLAVSNPAPVAPVGVYLPRNISAEAAIYHAAPLLEWLGQRLDHSASDVAANLAAGLLAAAWGDTEGARRALLSASIARSAADASA